MYFYLLPVVVVLYVTLEDRDPMNVIASTALSAALIVKTARIVHYVKVIADAATMIKYAILIVDTLRTTMTNSKKTTTTIMAMAKAFNSLQHVYYLLCWLSFRKKN